MIVTCPGCQTNYRLIEAGVRGGRVLLICPRCQTRFSVAVYQPPPLQTAAPEPPSAVIAAASERPEPAAPSLNDSDKISDNTATVAAETEDSAGSLRMLIADEPNELRGRIIAALNELAPELKLLVVNNGEEAIQALANFTPALAIIGAAIDKRYCFEICDFIRTTARLSSTRIVLASELHQSAWICGEPESLYGADAWFSNAASDKELRTILRGHLAIIRNHQTQPVA